MNAYSDNGVILQMQDYSIHDGDGVRTTIFLAGCPLRCQWCANPESQTVASKLFYYKHKCKGCGKCAEVCPHKLSPFTMLRPNPSCDVCSACANACPHKALAIACTACDVEQIVSRLKRDALFFRFTGGGVTFSGGEPFVQHQFLRSITQRLFAMGINMWIETCGYFDVEEVRDIIALLDHVFIDIKHMDSEIHQAYTGKDNARILQNAKRIYDMHIPITVRIPAIAELNLTDENIRATADFMAQHMPKAGIELLPYHELGKAKYIALSQESKFISFTTPSPQELAQAYEIFRRRGINIEEYK